MRKLFKERKLFKGGNYMRKYGMLEISISSLNHFVVGPTKTPKSADKKCLFLPFKVTFYVKNLVQMPNR